MVPTSFTFVKRSQGPSRIGARNIVWAVCLAVFVAGMIYGLIEFMSPPANYGATMFISGVWYAFLLYALCSLVINLLDVPKNRNWDVGVMVLIVLLGGLSIFPLGLAFLSVYAWALGIGHGILSEKLTGGSLLAGLLQVLLLASTAAWFWLERLRILANDKVVLRRILLAVVGVLVLTGMFGCIMAEY